VRVLVVGSGGREHALAWKLAQSPRLDALHAAPGNPGIARLGECHPVRAEDTEGILALCRELATDLVVVGPEAPLVAGLADALRHAGVAAFGPSLAAAQIEGSKAFAKDVLEAAGVPTAARLDAARPPCVVKADGLAAGKGVFVCETQEEVDHALRAAAELGDEIVVEERLEGEEVSLFVLTDGHDALPLAPAQDFKRIGDGDTGPNTGGMGAYSPVPGLGEPEIEELVDSVHRPIVELMRRRGTPYRGVLYAGLMMSADGPRVLEFNCRFGDPETQAILPRLEGDLLDALSGAALGALETDLVAGDRAAVSVVLAGGEYPESGDAGTPIEGIEAAEAAGALVFHAGTARRGETLVTNGGRILNVTATGDDLVAARRAAYEAAELISFDGMRFRRDIGLAAAEGHAVR
jgi:phosphoribosylamine---glycine ligase